MSKNKIIKAGRIASVPNPNASPMLVGSDVRVFGYTDGDTHPGELIKKYNNFETQRIFVVGDIEIHNDNGEHYYWAMGVNKTGGKYLPLYVVTHDMGLYISSSKKAIKKAIKKACGHNVK